MHGIHVLTNSNILYALFCSKSLVLISLGPKIMSHVSFLGKKKLFNIPNFTIIN